LERHSIFPATMGDDGERATRTRMALRSSSSAVMLAVRRERTGDGKLQGNALFRFPEASHPPAMPPPCQIHECSGEGGLVGVNQLRHLRADRPFMWVSPSTSDLGIDVTDDRRWGTVAIAVRPLPLNLRAGLVPLRLRIPLDAALIEFGARPSIR